MTFHQQTSDFINEAHLEMPPNNYWATCDKKNGGCLICVAKRQKLISCRLLADEKRDNNCYYYFDDVGDGCYHYKSISPPKETC